MILLYLSHLILASTIGFVLTILTVSKVPMAVSDTFLEFFVGLGVSFAQVSNAIGVDLSLPFSLLSPTFYVFFTFLILRFASFSAKRAVLLAVLFGLVGVAF